LPSRLVEMNECSSGRPQRSVTVSAWPDSTIMVSGFLSDRSTQLATSHIRILPSSPPENRHPLDTLSISSEYCGELTRITRRSAHVLASQNASTSPTDALTTPPSGSSLLRCSAAAAVTAPLLYVQRCTHSPVSRWCNAKPFTPLVTSSSLSMGRSRYRSTSTVLVPDVAALHIYATPTSAAAAAPAAAAHYPTTRRKHRTQTGAG